MRFCKKKKKETDPKLGTISIQHLFPFFLPELNDPLRTFITFIQFQVSTEQNPNLQLKIPILILFHANLSSNAFGNSRR